MTPFESLVLMISFASLVVSIIVASNGKK
ncbi:putative holin-like toxin [Bacillus marinisedimentorum]